MVLPICRDILLTRFVIVMNYLLINICNIRLIIRVCCKSRVQLSRSVESVVRESGGPLGSRDSGHPVVSLIIIIIIAIIIMDYYYDYKY